MAAQMTHAAANLLDTFFCMGRWDQEEEEEERPPRFRFIRPAVCLVAAAKWLCSSDGDEDPACSMHAQERLSDVILWSWLACCHSSLLEPETSFLDQVAPIILQVIAIHLVAAY